MLLFYSFYSKPHLFCQSFSVAKENEIAYVQDIVVKASPRREVACSGPAAIAQLPYSRVEWIQRWQQLLQSGGTGGRTSLPVTVVTGKAVVYHPSSSWQ